MAKKKKVQTDTGYMMVDIETKTKRNKDGELINPTKEDIKKFNEKYDTYSPKRKKRYDSVTKLA